MIKAALTEQLEKLKAEITNCNKENDLQMLHSKTIGRNGIFRELMDGIKELQAEDRKSYGQKVNSLKTEFQQLIEKQQKALFEKGLQKTGAADGLDLLVPALTGSGGSTHPITAIEKEIVEIFTGLGFSVASGPEMETDFYNFQALNIPEEHPARDMQDTYWLDNKMLLRTHTSPCQIRALAQYGVPVRVIAPGRCFRNEEVDASHENTFHQVEGLMVDKNISIANLVYVLKLMLGKIFNKDVTVRLRPGFFPFVEPGFELDIKCLICNGARCRTCSHTGWIELVPCGMVHRNVLSMSGVDPDQYTGFAFGLGLSRLVMMRYNIADVRMLNRGDLRELSQFYSYT